MQETLRLCLGSCIGLYVKGSVMMVSFFSSGPVAQLGARFHGMEEVVSSNLTRSTKTKPNKT